MDRNFGGVIWTDHALQRLRERGISQSDAWATWRNPEQSREGSNKNGSWVYYKTYPTPPKGSEGASGQKIEVVAKKNEKGEWIIMSVWSRPVYQNQSPVTNHQSSTGKSLARKIFELLFVKPENRK